MGQYINLFTDFGFKKVFGEEPNKDLLISFLNTLLPAKHQIAELDYSRNEWQRVSVLDDNAIFALHCKTPDGTYFIVELQKATQNYFKDRSLHYVSRLIEEQGQKGDWDFCLQAVYAISVLDFIFNDADKSDVIHTVQWHNHKNQLVHDKLTFIYITLPNFTKTLDELATLQDKWFFVFRHLSEIDDIPAALQERIFEKLFHVTELIALKPQEREAYQASLMYYRDLKNVIDTAYADGLTLGMKQGIEQRIKLGIKQAQAAAHQERLNTARNFKQLGISPEQIAQASGLTLAEIADL